MITITILSIIFLLTVVAIIACITYLGMGAVITICILVMGIIIDVSVVSAIIILCKKQNKNKALFMEHPFLHKEKLCYFHLSDSPFIFCERKSTATEKNKTVYIKHINKERIFMKKIVNKITRNKM